MRNGPPRADAPWRRAPPAARLYTPLLTFNPGRDNRGAALLAEKARRARLGSACGIMPGVLWAGALWGRGPHRPLHARLRIFGAASRQDRRADSPLTRRETWATVCRERVAFFGELFKSMRRPPRTRRLRPEFMRRSGRGGHSACPVMSWAGLRRDKWFVVF
jgi:hypothetical protein